MLHLSWIEDQNDTALQGERVFMIRTPVLSGTGREHTFYVVIPGGWDAAQCFAAWDAQHSGDSIDAGAQYEIYAQFPDKKEPTFL